VDKILVVSLKDYHYRVMMIASAVYGFAGLITGGSTTPALGTLLGHGAQYVWFATLLVCGTVVLLTLLMGKGLKAILIERAALTPMTGVIFSNGIASIATNQLKTFDWIILGVGILVIVVLLVYVKLLPAILAGVAMLILMGAQGAIIFFGFGVANLYRIFDVNNIVKEASSIKAKRGTEIEEQAPIKDNT
jgi:uncharacterized membrane protein